MTALEEQATRFFSAEPPPKVTPYEQAWLEQRWAALGSRIVLNADVWARLGRAALRAGLVVDVPARLEQLGRRAGMSWKGAKLALDQANFIEQEQHAKEADANSPG